MSDLSINQNEQTREAEMAVLGGLMLETHRFDSVIQIIKENDFHDRNHQIIFQAMSELVEENKPLDPLTVSEKLDSNNKLQTIGGKDNLIELATSTPSAANLEAYAEIIKQRSITRNLMKTNSEIAELIRNPQGQNGNELLDRAESMIFALNDEASQNDDSLQSSEELVRSTMDKLYELSNKEGSLIGASTGFKDLDKELQGLQDGDLIIVAGRPSMGKTSFAMNIAENVLLNKDNEGAVLIFSLEMPGDSLTTRMLSGMSKLNQQNVRSGMLKDSELNLLMEQGSKLKELPLWIDDSSLLTPMELRAKARRLARQEENGLSLIVVDYLQLMQLPASNDNRVNQISEISRSLKSLAKELNVPVVALSQLNRAVEQRDSKRPKMADLRDSGAIEQDADVILFIYRKEVYEPGEDEGQADIIIGKQRNGPIGTVKMTFLKEYTRFENFAPDKYIDEYSSQFE
jgi:replicative DNA helicase